MKIREINNEKYSLEKFSNYYWRVKIIVKDKDNNEYNFDIYTSETQKEKVEETLLNIITEKVKTLKITHWSTKKHDEIINELLKDI